MPPWTGCRVVAGVAGAVVLAGLMRGLARFATQAAGPGGLTDGRSGVLLPVGRCSVAAVSRRPPGNVGLDRNLLSHAALQRASVRTDDDGPCGPKEAR